MSLGLVVLNANIGNTPVKGGILCNPNPFKFTNIQSLSPRRSLITGVFFSYLTASNQWFIRWGFNGEPIDLLNSSFDRCHLICFPYEFLVIGFGNPILGNFLQLLINCPMKGAGIWLCSGCGVVFAFPPIHSFL